MLHALGFVWDPRLIFIMLNPENWTSCYSALTNRFFCSEFETSLFHSQSEPIASSLSPLNHDEVFFQRDLNDGTTFQTLLGSAWRSFSLSIHSDRQKISNILISLELQFFFFLLALSRVWNIFLFLDSHIFSIDVHPDGTRFATGGQGHFDFDSFKNSSFSLFCFRWTSANLECWTSAQRSRQFTSTFVYFD